MQYLYFFVVFRSQSNPLFQTQMMQSILSVLKTVIAVLQKCEGILSCDAEVLESLEHIIKWSVNILTDPIMLLECRSAAAMIIPAVALHLPVHMLHNVVSHICCKLNKKVLVSTEFVSSQLTEIISQSLDILFSSELIPSSILVVLHALLVKLPPQVLHSKFVSSSSNSSVFEEIFPTNLIEISQMSIDKSTLVLAFKTIALWVGEALRVASGNITNLSLIKIVTNTVLPHLVAYVDHQIDTIRHNVNSAMKNCFLLLSKSGSNDIIVVLSKEYFNGDMRSRGKISMLINICEFIKVDVILELRPTLPSDLIDLLSDVDLASHACDLYEIVCKKHLVELQMKNSYSKQWMDTWVQPIYLRLSDKNKEIKTNVVNHIIPRLLKVHPSIISELLADKVSGAKVRVVVVLLKSLRGMKNFANDEVTFDSLKHETGDENVWKHLIQMADMKMCLSHIDDQVNTMSSWYLRICIFLYYQKHHSATL